MAALEALGSAHEEALTQQARYTELMGMQNMVVIWDMHFELLDMTRVSRGWNVTDLSEVEMCWNGSSISDLLTALNTLCTRITTFLAVLQTIESNADALERAAAEYPSFQRSFDDVKKEFQRLANKVAHMGLLEQDSPSERPS